MITFTPEAVEQWLREHPEPADAGGPAARGPVVRISVAAGGCAGLKYVLEAADGPGADDLVFRQDGLTVLCAPADLPRLDGLQVDFVDAMVGGGYRFGNPNAGRSCGCGASFEEKNGPGGG
jgi:iron-sulfur cluster assembly accessory protein